MLPVTIPQGALWRMAWPVFGPDGDPVTDLRDWKIRAAARPRADSTEVLHTWTFPGPIDGGTNIEVFRAPAPDPAGGPPVDTDWFRLVVRPADSIPWTWTYAVAHIELERTPEEIARVAALAITVSAETTR